MSPMQDHFLRRESLALLSVALVLLAGAAALAVALALAGYTLADVAAWFVKVAG
ncbi:hypothetical protein [Methyloceanibacter sp.]|uniref:hypothetical protein n=1 Tax=Methyloceanibacter sp. TaxID=1965321 RepID=UPI002D6E2B6E|nr:hypothetical protein [Methyloceanibacter sp.]HZP08248.1 hypothetical protein [Methyloceanibacter sp.]